MNSLTALPAFTDNYIWCYRNAQGQSIVVDPGDAAPVLRALQSGMVLSAIFITHHHADHTAGIETLLQHQSVPVYGPRDARIAHISHPVGEQERITLAGFDAFTVLEVPGHTRSHIAFHNQELVFCGDTLFSLGCGRLFEGSAEQMLCSLDKLATLPNHTQVCCTHEYTASNAAFALKAEPKNHERDSYYQQIMSLRAQQHSTLPSTIEREKACNPFLRIDTPSVLAGLENHLGYLPASRTECFAALRAWKDQC